MSAHFLFTYNTNKLHGDISKRFGTIESLSNEIRNSPINPSPNPNPNPNEKGHFVATRNDAIQLYC